MKIAQLLLFFCFWLLICGGVNGQTIVGMGTDNPNPNAVLELVSANKNQGFLVPRLSTQQRNASSFISKLTDQDDGLMIFDIDEGNLYYWYNGTWKTGPGNFTTKGNVWYAGNATPDNNLGKDGDFYVDQSTNDVFRKQDGMFLLFGSLAKNENQYFAGTGISITNQNEIINTGDLDSTNELQDLSLSGTTLGLSGSATTVDLSPLQGGTGTDDQILSFSKAGNDVSLSIENGNTTIFSVADGDSVSTNELQDLSLRGTTLGLSGSATSVDLSPLQDGTGTDSQNLTSSKAGNDISISIDNGNTTTFSVADGDSVSTNELITSASLTAEDILRIQEAGNNHDVDLSGFQKTALPTGQVLVGNGSGVASPVSISGDITLNSDGTMTIQLDAVTTAKIINQAITTAKIADDAVTKDKINADLAGNGLAQNNDGSLEVNIAGGGIQLVTDQLQLMNSSNGEVLIGDGTQVNSRIIAGDITLANTGTATVTGLQGNPLGTTIPASNDILTWDGSVWVPQSPALVLNSTDGASWYAGNSAPSSLSLIEAVSGDYYFQTDTELVYNKMDDGSWVELGRWAKPSGDKVNGAIITSTTVSTLYIGSGQPVNGTTDNAQPGDMYFDTSEGQFGRIYIKKNSSEWQGL